MKLLREKMGFRNVVVMIPFCRSVAEADEATNRGTRTEVAVRNGRLNHRHAADNPCRHAAGIVECPDRLHYRSRAQRLLSRGDAVGVETL